MIFDRFFIILFGYIQLKIDNLVYSSRHGHKNIREKVNRINILGKLETDFLI